MSANPTVPEWFRTEYIDGVDHVFQNKGGYLLNTVRRKQVSSAKEAEFHIFGTLSVTDKTKAGEIPPQNAAHTKVKIEPVQKFVGAVIDQFDLDRMAEDDRDESKKAGGMALARWADDQIVAALDATGQANLGGAAQFMSPDFSQEINEELANKDVDFDEDVFCIISPRMWRMMMRFDDFKSADYTGPVLQNTGNSRPYMRTWDGKHWIMFNRLPLTGNLRRGFAYARKAVGHVSLKDLFVQFSWENKHNHWFLNMNQSQEAKILLDPGIVPFQIDESIDPASIDPATYTVV